MTKSNHSGLGKVALLSAAIFGGLVGIASAQETEVVPRVVELDKSVLDFNANLNSFEYDIGGRHDFNDKFGIGMGWALGVIIPSPQKIDVGIGPYAEFKAGPFVLKGGGKYWSNNVPSIFGEFAGEIPFFKPFNEQASLRISLGYDTLRKAYGGIGITFKENENKRGLKDPKYNQKF